MRHTIRAAATVFAVALSGTAFAAEPIVGHWKSSDGGLVSVSSCGDAYCATVIKGEHKGQSVGRFSGSDGDYSGTVTDPRDEKTYAGTAHVADGKLKLTGCALRVFCRDQVWVRG